MIKEQSRSFLYFGLLRLKVFDFLGMPATDAELLGENSGNAKLVPLGYLTDG